jgi:SAM-dependent methyltransferase
MKETCLEILREPDAGGELSLSVSEYRGGDIWEGTLRSPATGRQYPIRDGIPRFVPSEDYTASFGLQWNRFADVQLDSANGARYSHERFERETGWSRDKLEGNWILDGGCGCGRFAEVAAELGAQVIALDYSSAVDAAASNLAHLPNVHYVQADLLHLPIKRASLHFAYSIGVLQHTPSPEAALAAILEHVAPGGEFAFTIYARRWYTRYHSKYLLRPLTRRLPPPLLLRMIEAVMPVLYPVTEVAFSIPLFGKLAQFMIPVANYVDKKGISPEMRYREAVLDTFDMLAPSYDHPMTADEVRGVLERSGVASFSFHKTVPINVTGALAPRLCAT